MEAIAKKDGMVKSIMGYRMLHRKHVEQILMQLKSCAMQYPGFVDAEFLVSEGDQSMGLMISTWETMENWQTWVGSKGTESLFRRAKIAVMGAARLTPYRTMATAEPR
ncbi:MAG: antibiotic biosynthesis monooxygenase [Dehalococcoidia bacterium]|nr:antibiotic biosynthesis monooxygenase [Dehalococcoidia bacterium]MDH4299204.1 antibiotic biosynthesis monooxygenase [Dehalococcoidia bacterium]